MSTATKSVLNLHSSARSYGTTSNMTFLLGSNIPAPKSISCLSCELPNTFYNLADFNSTLALQLVSTSNQEVVKMRDTQNILRFRVYDGRTGTYPPATMFALDTFEKWVSFFNTADRDFRYAYTTGGAQLVKKTPLASVSITYNSINTYQQQSTLITNLTTLITQQLSGNIDITQDMLLSYRFQFDTASRRYKMWFNFIGLVVEVDTTGTLNPVFGFDTNETYGIYLPTNPVSKSFYYTIKVDQKNYEGSTLATELQSKLTTAVSAASDTTFLSSTPFTVSYDLTFHKMTITSNKLSGGVPVLANDLRILVDYKNSPLDDIIGIKDTQEPANPLTSAGILNVGGTNTVYITSDKASSFNINSLGLTSFTLQKIQMSEPFGSTVFYKSYHPDLERFNLDGLSGNDMSSISLSLRDYQGNLLQNNNTEWSISLLLWY
jgi:hypothetical protein